MTVFPSSTPSQWSPLLVGGLAPTPFASTAIPALLTQPEQRDTPEGQLFTFRFGNGYGAFVMRPHLNRSEQPLFDLCLIDCRGSEQPIFTLPLCPGPRSGLSAAQVSRLLEQAERLERHPAHTVHDRALLAERF